jgi:hypothetical protein
MARSSGTSGRRSLSLLLYAWRTHDGEREAVEIVLKRQVPADGQEHIELRLGDREEVAIPFGRPTHVGDSARVVSAQFTGEALR